MTISAFAPGKLILMGEHAVVYGHQAVAIAVDRGMTVTLDEIDGPSRLANGEISDPRLESAIRTVLPDEGVSVHIDSNLPIGRGMGSSAALAVALAKASLQFEGRPFTASEINKRAFSVERVFHGNPSGVDHTVSMRGGALLYRKANEKADFEALNIPNLPIVVIDSGSAGNTAHMVEGVRKRLSTVSPYLDQIGELVSTTIPSLVSGDFEAIGQAWHENHWLLKAIGVSTPILDEIVKVSENEGSYGSKLAGAGGGGIVIALAPDSAPIIEAANAHGWTAFESFLHPRSQTGLVDAQN